MLIVACCLAPLCMFGSPADFWFVAVGALVSTVAGCVIVLVKVRLGLENKSVKLDNKKKEKKGGWMF